MSVLLKRNVKRIEKFFSDNGVPVTITKNKARDKSLGSHKIEPLISSVEKCREIIEKVFPSYEKPASIIFYVNITDDFIICRCCGCSDFNACAGGCYWVEMDLCSTCINKTVDKNQEVPA